MCESGVSYHSPCLHEGRHFQFEVRHIPLPTSTSFVPNSRREEPSTSGSVYSCASTMTLVLEPHTRVALVTLRNGAGRGMELVTSNARFYDLLKSAPCEYAATSWRWVQWNSHNCPVTSFSSEQCSWSMSPSIVKLCYSRAQRRLREITSRSEFGDATKIRAAWESASDCRIFPIRTEWVRTDESLMPGRSAVIFRE